MNFIFNVILGALMVIGYILPFVATVLVIMYCPWLLIIHLMFLLELIGRNGS